MNKLSIKYLLSSIDSELAAKERADERSNLKDYTRESIVDVRNNKY